MGNSTNFLPYVSSTFPTFRRSSISTPHAPGLFVRKLKAILSPLFTSFTSHAVLNSLNIFKDVYGVRLTEEAVLHLSLHHIIPFRHRSSDLVVLSG